MIYNKRYPVFILALLLLLACQVFTGTTTVEPALSTKVTTATPAPITPTVQQPTVTQPPRPTETLPPTATTLPPSPTPEPFLPEGLPLIGAENILELQKVSTIPVREIYALAFSQSGNKLATLSERWQDRTNYLEVWDLVRGEQILYLDHLDNPWAPYFSPDETGLFIFYANRGIEVYDLVQTKLARTVEINADWPAYSPDGKTIAVGDYLGIPDESTVRVINLDTKQELLAWTTPGMVMHLKFSPGGNLLVGGFQGPNHFRDYVWDIYKEELVVDLMDYDYGLTFSPERSIAATAKGGRVYIFSTEGWVLRSSYGFADPYSDVKPRSFSPNGDILAVEDRNNVIFLETDTGEELLSLPDACDARFSPEGTTLVTWCYQSEINMWGVIP